jgi:hypothetical protein
MYRSNVNYISVNYSCTKTWPVNESEVCFEWVSNWKRFSFVYSNNSRWWHSLAENHEWMLNGLISKSKTKLASHCQMPKEKIYMIPHSQLLPKRWYQLIVGSSGVFLRWNVFLLEQISYEWEKIREIRIVVVIGWDAIMGNHFNVTVVVLWDVYVLCTCCVRAVYVLCTCIKSVL